jgi:hypothetical protein
MFNIKAQSCCDRVSQILLKIGWWLISIGLRKQHSWRRWNARLPYFHMISLNEEEVESFIGNAAKAMPPIKGVIQGAMLLRVRKVNA